MIASWTALAIILVISLYVIIQWFLCQRAVQQGYIRLGSYNAQIVALSHGNIAYMDKGNGKTILVVHGINGGYDQAYDTAKGMQDQYRILAPSRFGYLSSDMPNETTPAAQAKAYVDLLDKLGIEKVYILGTSAGGTIAIRFALDYPERTAGLILYCSAAPKIEKPEKYIRYQGPPSFLCTNFGMWLVKPLFRPIMGMDRDTIYEMMPINERRDGMLLDASITNPDMARNYDEYPIENLQVPTIIFHAQDDKLASYSAMEQASSRFPNCTFVSFESGGHLMTGHSAEIETALDKFITAN